MTKAPIDQDPPKGLRAAKPPLPDRLSPTLEARHLVPLADTLAAGGPSGEAISTIAIRAMESFENTYGRVYDAMNAVNVEQAEMEQAGHPPARVIRTPEGLRAVGTKYAELADAADPLLAKEQDKIDAAIRSVASHRERMMKTMDDSLVCNKTATDAPLRQDMRAHLRGLGHHKAVHAAINAATKKDATTVHVVLTSPPALMGLEPADVEKVREEARKAFNPDLHKAHVESQKVIDRMIKASKANAAKKAKVASYRIMDQQAANDALAALRKG